tara:strand:+ start:276 stop:569 length:294 start_codon:yes stop_codon:yes gene_type:complete
MEKETKTMKEIKEYKIEGKSIEQYWTDKISKALVGKTITKVEYIGDQEMEDSMWYKKPIAICLDNRYWLIPMSDDEGNDGGSIRTTISGLQVIPVLY